MKKQTDIAKKQYHELIKVHGLNKTVMSKKRENSDLVYNNFDFKKFSITDEECNELFNKINELRMVKSRAVGTKKRKVIVNDTASK